MSEWRDDDPPNEPPLTFNSRCDAHQPPEFIGGSKCGDRVPMSRGKQPPGFIYVPLRRLKSVFSDVYDSERRVVEVYVLIFSGDYRLDRVESVL